MATNGDFDINSKLQLKSGYEIPVLGFGVSDVRTIFEWKSTDQKAKPMQKVPQLKRPTLSNTPLRTGIAM
ncbi:hypothetical protein SLS55_008627 [Diplodia seriata]|uniref:Uncharacterized protein n=1 Tax=Diplodia seriata TaxID=420778 RepID=A0ABR3C6J0_9PEZI